jgi:hypothetical protein
MNWLLLAAAAYLLFEIWRGWRRGVVRHGISVTALLIAGGIGWVFAWMTGFISDRIIPLTPPGGRIIFGFAAGIAFYVAAVVLSSLLFKKTSQQSSGVVRLFYGAGGAFFGFIFGIVVLWGGITLLRAVGAIAEGQEAAAQHGGRPVLALDSRLAALKESLEAGSTGQVVDKVDILPSDSYGLLSKLVQVSQSPDAAMRLLAYPGMQQLLAQPKLAAVFQGPALLEASHQGNILAVLTSPKLAAAVSDPEVQQSFAEFDWQKALDYAINASPPSPTHE